MKMRMPLDRTGASVRKCVLIGAIASYRLSLRTSYTIKTCFDTVLSIGIGIGRNSPQR